MSTIRYTDEHGNTVEEEIDDRDAWDFLQSLDERYQSKPDPARDARFEAVMRARRSTAQPVQPQRATRRRRRT